MKALLSLFLIFASPAVGAQGADPSPLSTAQGRIGSAILGSGALDEWRQSQHGARERTTGNLALSVRTDARGAVDSVGVVVARNVSPDVINQIVAAVRTLVLPETPSRTAEFTYTMTYEPPRLDRNRALWLGVTAGLTVGAVSLVMALFD